MMLPSSRQRASLAAFFVLFVAFLLWRSERGTRPSAAGLKPGAVEQVSQVGRGLPDLPEPLLATPEEAEEEGTTTPATERKPLSSLAWIRGRLLFKGNPVPEMSVYLQLTSEATVVLQEVGYQVEGAETSALGGDLKITDLSFLAATDEDGVFEFSDLKPDAYTLQSSLMESIGSGDGDDASPTAVAQYLAKIVALEGMNDLGDIELQGQTLSDYAFQLEVFEPAKIQVQSGQPGLIVRVYEQGSTIFHDSRKRTDGNGEATLRRKQATAIRIDLIDRDGHVLGSTDAYHSYPLGLDTIVPIPAVPGTLALQLARGTELQSGEKVQITLLRNSSPAQHVLVKSFWGSDAPRQTPGLAASSGAIEFKALRAGTYSVKAIRKIVQPGEPLSTPTGDWMYGTAHVYPGQLTTCRLK